jgi:predicted nucleic acid-binding Zn ribbon protein
MLFCQYCGAASPDDSHFCRQCGRSLSTSSPSTADRRSSRRVYVRWLILITALIIIGAGTIKTLPLIASGSSPTRTPPKTEPSMTASQDFSPFVGTWSGHGRLLTFALNGNAQYTARAYQWCGQGVPLPCDSMQGNEIIDGINEQLVFTRTNGSTAYGTITFSTAGDTGQQVAASLRQEDTIALYYGNAIYSILCGSQAPAGYCGA